MDKIKALLLFAFLLLPLGLYGQTVSWTWANAPQNASYPTCPAVVPASCLAYYELDNITIPSAPVVISKTISPTAGVYTQTSGISYGNMMVSLALYYYDQNGVLQKTAADTASLLVTFSALPASGLKGVQQ